MAFTLAAANLIPDGKLYIWDIETDDIMKYDFRKHDGLSNSDFGDTLESEFDELNTDDESDVAFDEICKNRIPLSLYWCEEDARLLICDAKKIKKSNPKKTQPQLTKNGKCSWNSKKSSFHLNIFKYSKTIGRRRPNHSNNVRIAKQ